MSPLLMQCFCNADHRNGNGDTSYLAGSDQTWARLMIVLDC